MSDPIVILTEEPLGADDRVNIETLVADGDSPLVVLVPANTERHLLVDFLENLSLLEIAKAFRELTAKHPDPAAERTAAAETLAAGDGFKQKTAGSFRAEFQHRRDRRFDVADPTPDDQSCRAHWSDEIEAL